MNQTMDYAMETFFSGSASLVSLAIAILLFAGIWKIFEKAGESGIKSIIPIYNAYIMYKIVWGNGLLFLLLLIPLVNIIISIVHSFKLAKCFGQNFLFGLGLIILPFIFYPLLGFGDYQYYGPDNGSRY